MITEEMISKLVYGVASSFLWANIAFFGGAIIIHYLLVFLDKHTKYYRLQRYVVVLLGIFMTMLAWSNSTPYLTLYLSIGGLLCYAFGLLSLI